MAIDPQYNLPLSADDLNSQIPLSVLYGVTPGDKFIPIRIDDDGRVQISADTPVIVDDVDIIIKGVDPEDGNTEHRISVDDLGVGNGFAMRTALFDNGNKLKINADGSLDVTILSGSFTLDNATSDILIYGQDSGTVNRPLRVNTSGQAEVAVISSVLPTGAATETTLSGIKTQTDNLTFVSTRLLVDGSGVTQPVSVTNATLAVTQSGTWNLNNISGTISLPTGASTEATLATRASEVTLAAIKAQTDQLTFSSGILQIGGTVASTQSGTWSMRLQDGSGNTITSTSNALDVNIKSGVTLEVNLDDSNDSVQIFGNDGVTNRAVKTTTAGEVITDPLDKVAREIGRITASHVLFATESYNTINTYASARPVNGNLNVQHYPRKQWVIKNTGVNSARITVTGSVDAGSNFDVTLTNNLKLDPGNVIVTDEVRPFTTIQIQARSDAAGQPTSIETRGYALGS